MTYFRRHKKPVKPPKCEFTQADLKKFNANFKAYMAKRGIETGRKAWLSGPEGH